MKTIVLLGITGIALFTTMKNTSQYIAGAKNKLVIFGPVNFSDDDELDTDYDTEGHEGNWLENFIKNHKTPFSKTIQK